MKLFLKTEDFAVSNEKFDLVHDPEMDMLITQPRPKNLASYYESASYISHTDEKSGIVNRIYQWVKRYSIKSKLRLVAHNVEDRKAILDFGAGTGDFLQKAKLKGWHIQGVEPNKKARSKAKEKGIDLLENLELLPNDQQFDVITLWHVLEHIPDLETITKKLVDLLKENGSLIIAVPNYKSYDALYYKKYWAAYDVPRHLWHFSQKSIVQLFTPKGMKLIGTKPMYFDAFYVSLLSEKYKTGSQQLLSAFWTGLRSNYSAFRTGEYSSLIYLLKKASN